MSKTMKGRSEILDILNYITHTVFRNAFVFYDLGLHFTNPKMGLFIMLCAMYKWNFSLTYNTS